MPNRCVVEGCSNVANPAGGISLHFIPFAGDERPEAKRRRKQWVDSSDTPPHLEFKGCRQVTSQ